MKLIAFIIIFFISHAISASERVNLMWNIKKDEIVAYKTKMSPPKDGSDNFIKLDFE